MEANFEQLITALNLSPLSADVLQPTHDSLSSFVLHNYELLITLEREAWRILSLYSQESFRQSSFVEFFQTLAAFNTKMIFNQGSIKDDMKLSLLFPETVDQTNNIFQQIEQSHDHNDPFVIVASLWFDNLTVFVHEYPRFGHLPIITHINQYFGHHYIMSEQFKTYLTELHQSSLPSFTAKQLFYLKTCPFSLNAYFYTNPSNYNYTPEQVINHIREAYLQLIQVQSTTVELWSKELLACITHLIGFLRAFLWWNGENGTKLRVFFSTEKILCEYIQALIRIIEYKPFYNSLMPQWSNNETILIDSILLSLMNIVQTQNINWFFRSIAQLPGILLKLTELTVYFRIYLCAYGILSETLTDEHLKELRFTDYVINSFFNMLQQAWHDPLKRFKQIPIDYILKGFLHLSKNDSILQESAKLNRISLFIEMCGQYPIAFDIIWALSFNKDIQQQIRSSSAFMSKLVCLAKESNDKQMRKIVHGILWNLEINHEDRPAAAEINDGKIFDIMISYSHKDKELCKQIYNELIKVGYRVWIDFDQMHGNVMDAMAQAIEQSKIVIICMSEDYRKSNYCRAEAHYAFQRERKIVPALLQKHYKPDGWLLFLIGQLLYVDFNKYEFVRAMEMLFKELKVDENLEINISPVLPRKDTHVTPPLVSVTSSPRTSSQNILDWTREQVQEWLIRHDLVQMSRLLTNCDGRSLVYLSKYMKSCQSQQILNLLQDDSLRRTKQNVSLIELSCFHSLMDQQKQLFRSVETNTNIEKKDF